MVDGLHLRKLSDLDRDLRRHGGMAVRSRRDRWTEKQIRLQNIIHPNHYGFTKTSHHDADGRRTAIAVESAPTNTDVRRRDPARPRVASSASTPNTRRIKPAVIADKLETSSGIVSAQAAIESSAER